MTQRDGLEIINGIDSPHVNCVLTSSEYKTRLENSLNYRDRATVMRASYYEKLKIQSNISLFVAVYLEL